MRVLYCSQGQAVHDRRFLAAIRDQGHDVTYLRLGGERMNGALPDGTHEIQAVRGVWPLVAPAQGIALRSAVRSFQPSVIHAGPVQRGSFLTAVQGFGPLVTMSWGSDILMDARSGAGRVAAEYTLARSSAFLCDCEAVRTRAVELGMDRNRILTFPWGVDLEHFSPEPSSDLRKQLGWQENLVLISTRAWRSLYGLEILVQGFIEAARAEPHLRLLLLNAGPSARSIEAAIAGAKLSDRVHFAGLINQHRLPDYYRSADLYLSASRSDGSSVSLLEAMACGLPAIVSDIPGNREWVEPGRTGWLFEDGNAAALAGRILEAVSTESERHSCSRGARRVAEQRADWSANALKLTEAYELALQVEAERWPKRRW